MSKPEALIRLATLEPATVTVDEYERMALDLQIKARLGALTLGEQILGALLSEHRSRYAEAKRLNATPQADSLATA